jgi:phosphohistidine swiveling domain-containing protein
MVQLTEEGALLRGEEAASPSTAGGKGAALAKLASGFPVPPFFVIPADAIDENGIRPEIQFELTTALAELGPGPFAVRSSGREEDGADSAHAGQFETELNVPAAGVAAAAQRVWRSGFSETLAQYRRAKGLSGAPQPPAVVVQVMVRARAAGVAFSADPVSGDRKLVVISAIEGLADKLVGGEADGDSYRIDSSGRTVEQDIVGARPVLDDAERAQVAAMARRSESFFGKPQDIEWAFDARGLHMLQSRPITTLGAPEPARTPPPRPPEPKPVVAPVAAAPPPSNGNGTATRVLEKTPAAFDFGMNAPGAAAQQTAIPVSRPEAAKIAEAKAALQKPAQMSPILRGGPAGFATGPTPAPANTFQDFLAKGAPSGNGGPPTTSYVPPPVEPVAPPPAPKVEARPEPSPPPPPPKIEPKAKAKPAVDADWSPMTPPEEPHGRDWMAEPLYQADTREPLTIWDNSNIVESYPGVTSPLTFSFARYVYSHVYQAFSRMMGVSRRNVEDHRAVFENMLGRVDGRVYYNLLNWYRALALFPGFKANRAFMEGMMGVSEALPQEIADEIAPPTRNILVKLADNLNFARVGIGLIWHQLWIRVSIGAFYKRLNAALATSDSKIDAMQPMQLAAEYRKLEQKLLARWDAPLINDFLCMIAFGATQKTMEKQAGADGLAFLSGVLIGQGDIISAEPARLIREMGAMAAADEDLVARLDIGEFEALAEHPKLKLKFDQYIRKFGDRCTQELKLESRTLHEDPTQVLMAIAAAARTAPRREAGPSHPSIDLIQQASDAEGKPKDPLQPLIPNPWNRFWAKRLLGWARSRVRDRENLRFERTRLFGRVRRIFLALGARFEETKVLDDKRDVFALTVDELLGAVEGAGITSDLKALAALRKAEIEAELARPDPPERFSIKGAHIVGAAGLTEQPAKPDDQPRHIRKGLACCRGVVTAKVRVIEDPRVEALAPGEILVARHTDPGWIAVFANAAGVIAERGSLLSHSAIVAREMGVPCVVALKGATTWLKTGDVVKLDGGAGTVEKAAGKL